MFSLGNYEDMPSLDPQVTMYQLNNKLDVKHRNNSKSDSI